MILACSELWRGTGFELIFKNFISKNDLHTGLSIVNLDSDITDNPSLPTSNAFYQNIQSARNVNLWSTIKAYSLNLAHGLNLHFIGGLNFVWSVVDFEESFQDNDTSEEQITDHFQSELYLLDAKLSMELGYVVKNLEISFSLAGLIPAYEKNAISYNANRQDWDDQIEHKGQPGFELQTGIAVNL